MDSNTLVKEVIAVIEKRLERTNGLAKHFFDKGDDDMWQWYQSRARSYSPSTYQGGSKCLTK